MSLLFSFSSVNAERKISYSPLLISDYSLTVQNLKQTAANKLEFDVYLLSTDATQPFVLTLIEFGFLFNSGIYAGGTATVSMDLTTSQLSLFQDLSTINPILQTNAAFPNQTLLLMATFNPVSFARSTTISKVGNGTLITHLIITSSVAFVKSTTPDLVFCSSAVLSPYYPTIVTEWINSLSTILVTTPGVNANVIGNPVLNPTPTALAVTGTGSYCIGNVGLPVGLVSSEIGTTYTLYQGVTPMLPTVLGTGAAISFGNQLAGTYTIQGTATVAFGGTTIMSGNAVITENPLVAAGVSILASANPANTGVSVTFTATPVGGGTAPIYQWYKGAALVGTNTNTYAYIPLNGDIISVKMTSNAPCVSGSPITCIPVTMSVSIGTSLDQNKMSIDIYSKDKNILVTCSQKARQVSIYNTLGSMIRIENNVTGLKTFYMNDYPTEYYFVKVVTDNDVYTQKVLLK